MNISHENNKFCSLHYYLLNYFCEINAHFSLNFAGVQADSSSSATAFAGDHVTLTVSGADPNVLHTGDFLCDPASPIPLASRVQARIVLFNIIVPLIKGAQVSNRFEFVGIY